MCERQQSYWLSWLRKGRIGFEFQLFDKAYDFRWPSISGFSIVLMRMGPRKAVSDRLIADVWLMR